MNSKLKIQRLEALRVDILSGIGYAIDSNELARHAENIKCLIEALSQQERDEYSNSDSIFTVLSMKSGCSNDKIKELIFNAGGEFLVFADPENSEKQSLNAHFWAWWETRIYRVLVQLNNTLPLKETASNRQRIRQAVISEIKKQSTRASYNYRFSMDKI